MTICCGETNKAAGGDDFGEAIRGLWRRGPIGGGDSAVAAKENDVGSLLTIIGRRTQVSSGGFGALNGFNRWDSCKKVATFGRHLENPERFTVESI